MDNIALVPFARLSARYGCVLAVLSLAASGCVLGRGPAAETEPGPAPETEVRPSGAEIRALEIDRSGEQSVEALLQGRIAGVTVVPGPNGGLQLRVRGATSFTGSAEPLIVVDGKPLARGYSGLIPVSPYDIESIRVLKNAADMAFYGSRGANGIIEIKTKRGY